MNSEFRKMAAEIAAQKTLPDLDGWACARVLSGALTWREANAMTNTRRAEIEAGR